MKKRSGVYMILIVLSLFIQQIISGCATTATKGVTTEELIKEAPAKEEVVKVLPKETAGPDGQKLYESKCSPCHVLPDIKAYGFTFEQWVKTMDGMHDTVHEYSEYNVIITPEVDAKIKAYLKSKSQ